MDVVKMKYNFTESGYCQVHYTTKNGQGQTINYCLMEEGNDKVGLYRTTGGDWHEADYRVTLREGSKIEFETPPDEYGQKVLKMYNEGN